MCMLCVIQKWSRRVATMLPWLVLPLIGLWALSQLLPPAFRFEITSPRLACVFVLLVTLFWYEVLMPFLSAWRMSRNARLRERKRFEALELQKLKKTATRKCRNCLTPYRDQNPGGGKFMCSYCGHISKRPVLDLPLAPGMVDSRSGVIYDLFGKGGRILNGNSWSDNVSICSQDWMENGSWIVNGSFPVKSGYPLRKSDGFFGGSEPCLVGEKSYSGSLFVACKLLTSCLASIRWLWRKLFGIDSSKDDSSTDADRRGMLSKKYENTSGPETRGEKARRKAEEKRQARLEKELLEEEERKQREEVAKLVEERRRLRDEKTEAENRAKGTFSLRENNSKKEAEKRRQEKRKEKDKGSSKSNSDVEELDKKVVKVSLKTGLESVKGYIVESGTGLRSSNCSNNCGQGHVGARYFDRMRGTFLSSSKAFTDRGFKEVKLGANGRRDVHAPDRQGKFVMNGDDRSDICPVKATSMSWQHLFTQSPSTPAPAPTSSSSSHSNVISRPITKPRLEMQNSHPPCSVSSPQLYDNPINLPLPFVLPFFSSTVSNTCAETSRDLLPEEPELFEDPCYEPDPVSLLGPVSESLDNFQLDLGNSFRSDEVRKPRNNPINVSTLPIESPISKQNNSIHMYTFPTADVDGMSDKGSWRMWNSSPLGPDGLSWIGPLEWNGLNAEDIIHYTPPKTMASLFLNDGPKGQQVCPYGSSIPCLNDQEPWLQNTCFSAYSSGESHVTISPITKEGSQKNVGFDHAYDSLSANSWSKNEWAPHGNGNPAVTKSPPVRGLFSPPDVQSLW